MPRSTARNSPEVLGRPIDLQADDRRLHIKRAVLGSHGTQHSKADSTPRRRGTGDESQSRGPSFGPSTWANSFEIRYLLYSDTNSRFAWEGRAVCTENLIRID